MGSIDSLERTRLSNRGKRRAWARDIWDDLRAAKSDSPPDVVTHDGQALLGSRLIARALLDLAELPLEVSWSGGGLSESFVRRGQGDLRHQDVEQFIRCINRHLALNFRSERVPRDVFDRRYRDVDEVFAACQSRGRRAGPAVLPVDVPDVDELAGSDAEDVYTRLTQFARESGRGLFLLYAEPGGGRRSIFARLLKDMAGYPALAIYVSGNDMPSYPQIIRHLYLNLVPTKDRFGEVDARWMLRQIERALRTRHVVIVFNGFDVFDDQLEGSTSLVRGENVLRILDFIFPSCQSTTRVFVGTTTPFPLKSSEALECWAQERDVRLSKARLSGLQLQDGRTLILRSHSATCELAAACYSAFLRENFPAERETPSPVIIALAASFSLCEGLPSPLGDVKDLPPPEDVTSAHFKPDEWQAFTRRWSAVRDAARDHDVQKLLAFILKNAPDDLVTALRLIALSEDGLQESSLVNLLTNRCPEISDVQGLVGRILEGALQPLVQRGVCEASGSGPEAHFDTNRTLRRHITQLSEEDPAIRAKIRSYHAGIAALALKRYREEVCNDFGMDRTHTHRRPIQFVRHELAGLSPEALARMELPSRSQFSSKSDYDALGERVQRQTASLAERFCYALMFFERDIKENREPCASPVYAGDVQKLELLVSVFHLGFMLAPCDSLLASKPMILPMALPIADDGSTDGGRDLTRALHGIRDILVQIRRLTEEEDSQREIRERAQIAERLVEHVGLVRQEARARWALWLYGEVALAALRLDFDTVFLSASLFGEQIASFWGERSALWCFRENWCSWRLRRGKIRTGEDTALLWTKEMEAVVSAGIREVNRDPGKSTIGSYRCALRAYHHLAGRLADFASVRGAYRQAFDRYQVLARSSLATPGAVIGTFDAVPGCGDRIEHPEYLCGSSARNFLRFAWRLYLLFETEEPEDPLRRFTHACLPVDENTFERSELTRIVELARAVVRRELARLDHAPEGSGEEVAAAIESSAMFRFYDLVPATDDRDFIELGRNKLEIARMVALTGNVSVMRHLRLLLEEARLSWHTVLFGRRDMDSERNAPHTMQCLTNALSCISRAVAIADRRLLQLKLVDGLLLRAEIVRACMFVARSEEGEHAEALRRRIDVDSAEKVAQQYGKLWKPETDLDRAKEAITETGYRRRSIELSVLMNHPGAIPCACLVT